MTRDVVFPAQRHACYEQHRYPPAIRSNDFLLVSGQVGSRTNGSPESKLEDQIRLAFAKLDAVLAAAGTAFADVVDVTRFMVDAEARFARICPVLLEHWSTGAQRPSPR